MTKSPDDPAIRINGGFSVQLFILQISFPFVATACTTNGTNNVINAAYPRYAYPFLTTVIRPNCAMANARNVKIAVKTAFLPRCPCAFFSGLSIRRSTAFTQRVTIPEIIFTAVEIAPRMISREMIGVRIPAPTPFWTSTTMHSVPGLPVLHSKDLVNWELLSYALTEFDLGEEFRLEQGKESYGQGIWAPCIRYHEGVFYIFSNINRHGLQVFTSADPRGPWTRHPIGENIYDLSVLFENGKIYVVYGQTTIKLVELKTDLSGIVPGTERVIIPDGHAMGEGNHLYKIDGKYYIVNADNGRMQCARSEHIYGPYETVVISSRETMGTQRAWWTMNMGQHSALPLPGDTLSLAKEAENIMGAVPMHQGGIVDLPNGEWWGFSMMDFRSVGRTVFLSPVTWVDSWPYFGLKNNLGRSPRTWYKPNVGVKETAPYSPFERDDSFNEEELSNAWQWNHEPVYKKWELEKGKLKLYTMPAKSFLTAKNSLTQRGIGPVSYATVELDGSKLKAGDVAGLGLMNIPYAWIGLVRTENEWILRYYDLYKNKTIDCAVLSSKIALRAYGDFDNDWALLSYCADEGTFEVIGDTIRLPYQLKTFQGTRYALFAYNMNGVNGGYAAFDNFKLEEPMADRSMNLPLGKHIMLINKGDKKQLWANPHGVLSPSGSRQIKNDACFVFKVHDRGNGRVALEAMNGTGFLTVVGAGLSADVRLIKNETEGSLFMWQDMLRGECMLLSLKTNRFIGLHPETGELYSADWPGTLPARKDGTVFEWRLVFDVNH